MDTLAAASGLLPASGVGGLIVGLSYWAGIRQKLFGTRVAALGGRFHGIAPFYGVNPREIKSVAACIGSEL